MNKKANRTDPIRLFNYKLSQCGISSSLQLKGQQRPLRPPSSHSQPEDLSGR